MPTQTRTRLLFFGVTLSSILLAACQLPPELAAGPAARDANVTAKVEAALRGDAAMKNLDIAVATLNGDVRLTAVVERQSQIDHAISLARSIHGARTIRDELVLRKAGI